MIIKAKKLLKILKDGWGAVGQPHCCNNMLRSLSLGSERGFPILFSTTVFMGLSQVASLNFKHFSNLTYVCLQHLFKNKRSAMFNF